MQWLRDKKKMEILYLRNKMTSLYYDVYVYNIQLDTEITKLS